MKENTATAPEPIQDPDKYDVAIAYLKRHPDQIEDAWGNPLLHEGGVLFQFATKDGAADADFTCGCLTQIRGAGKQCEVTRLTQQIARDERIPTASTFIRVKHLPVFAEWQRRLDKELKRTI